MVTDNSLRGVNDVWTDELAQPGAHYHPLDDPQGQRGAPAFHLCAEDFVDQAGLMRRLDPWVRVYGAVRVTCDTRISPELCRKDLVGLTMQPTRYTFSRTKLPRSQGPNSALLHDPVWSDMAEEKGKYAASRLGNKAMGEPCKVLAWIDQYRQAANEVGERFKNPRETSQKQVPSEVNFFPDWVDQTKADPATQYTPEICQAIIDDQLENMDRLCREAEGGSHNDPRGSTGKRKRNDEEGEMSGAVEYGLDKRGASFDGFH